MKKKYFTTCYLATLLALCVIFTGNVFAATVTVGYGSLHNYTKSSGGSIPTTEFQLSFDDGLVTYGYCIDPTRNISGGTYGYTEPTWSTAFYQAAWLMDQHAPTGNTRDNTVALQASIWSAVAGTEYAPVSEDSASSKYNSWYSVLPTSFTGDQMADFEQRYRLVQPGVSRQTLIAAAPAVPVPAAVWLFGSGLLGLIGLRRRAKQ